MYQNFLNNNQLSSKNCCRVVRKNVSRWIGRPTTCATRGGNNTGIHSGHIMLGLKVFQSIAAHKILSSLSNGPKKIKFCCTDQHCSIIDTSRKRHELDSYFFQITYFEGQSKTLTSIVSPPPPEQVSENRKIKPLGFMSTQHTI